MQQWDMPEGWEDLQKCTTHGSRVFCPPIYVSVSDRFDACLSKSRLTFLYQATPIGHPVFSAQLYYKRLGPKWSSPTLIHARTAVGVGNAKNGKRSRILSNTRTAFYVCLSPFVDSSYLHLIRTAAILKHSA